MRNISNEILILYMILSLLICSCTVRDTRSGVIDETETSISGIIIDSNNHSIDKIKVQLHYYPVNEVKRIISREIPQMATTFTFTDSLGYFSIRERIIGKVYIEIIDSIKNIGKLDSLIIDDYKHIELGTIKTKKLGLLTIPATFISDQSDIWIKELNRFIPNSVISSEEPIITPLGNYTVNVMTEEATYTYFITPKVYYDSTLIIDSSYVEDSNTSIQISVRLDSLNSNDTYITFGYNASLQSKVSGTFGNRNAGKMTCYTIGTYDLNTISRILLHFPIPTDLVADSVIEARIVLHPLSWIEKNSSSNIPIAMHKVLVPWLGGNGYNNCSLGPDDYNDSIINGATAHDRFWTSDSSAIWTEVGVGLNDIDATSDYIDVDTIPSHSQDSVAFNATEIVKSWILTPALNHGILLRHTNEFNSQIASYPLFHSSESSNITLRPVLYISVKQ